MVFKSIREANAAANATATEYMKRAREGHNPYNLEYDKEWAKFLFTGYKMNWKKWISLFLLMLPCLSRTYIMLPVNLTIRTCAQPKGIWLERMEYSECIKANNNSPFIKASKELLNSEGREQLDMFQSNLLAPYGFFIYFFAFLQTKNRSLMWLRGAKISLRRGDKWCWAVFLWILIFLAAFFAVGGAIFSWDVMSGNFYINRLQRLQKTSASVIFYYEEDNQAIALSLLTTLSTFSIIVLAMAKFMTEPMLFFYGFQTYTKKAQKVSYNVHAVDYRISHNNMTDTFYRLSNAKDCYEDLIGLVTYLMDNNLLLDENGKKLS